MLLELAQIHHNDMVPIIAISVGGGIAILAIVLGITHNIVINANREKSRREIAAYIAEGSMTPEEGERLLTAGRSE
ncbi:MAG: hypothetical protein AAFQ17_06310, partial [Pseudomonadota bacterium]